MENTKTKVKEFFLELSSQVAFYTVIISLGNMLFKIINKAYGIYGNYYYGVENFNLALPLSILIVSFPIFAILTILLEKNYILNPENKDILIKRLLTYLTLFVSSVVFSISIIIILYKFLDGQEILTGFAFKIITVIILSALSFSYYLAESRNRLNLNYKKISIYVLLAIVVGSTILGFVIIGSPSKQRQLKEDSAMINDMRLANSQIESFYYNKSRLPDNLKELTSDSYYYINNNSKITYQKVTENSYKICGDFNFDYVLSPDAVIKQVYPAMPEDTDWMYKKGKTCFDKNTERLNKKETGYPTIPRFKVDETYPIPEPL